MVEKQIMFICPSLLEPATLRGGGIEEIDYQIAKNVSTYSKVTIIGPYYKKFEKSCTISENLVFEYVPFPAVRHYPPRSQFDQYTLVLVYNPIYSLFLGLKLITFLFRKNPSLVILHNGLPGLVASIIFRLANKRILFSEGNLTPWTTLYLYPKKYNIPQKCMKKIDLLLGKNIAKLSNCIRVQSNSIKKGMILNAIPEKKIFVIEGGVDTDNFYPKENKVINSEFFNIGFIGRLTEEKGVKILLKIIEITQTKLPNIKFFVFGDGPLRQEFNNYANIEFVGAIPKNEMNNYLANVKMVVFFQRDLGLAVLESLAAGKTILACNIGEIPYIIQHLENGVLCEPSVKSFVDTIGSLTRDPFLIDKISKKARMTALNEFDWSIIFQKWNDLLLKCELENIK